MPDNKSGSDNPVYGSVGLAELSVTSQKLAEGAIVTQKIRDKNVTTVKLADQAITTAKLADGVVTADKIAPGAVTNAIANGTITYSMLSALNYSVSGTISQTKSSSGSAYSNSTVNITTSGNPVLVILIGLSSNASIQALGTSDVASVEFGIRCDSSIIGGGKLRTQSTTPQALTLDTPPGNVVAFHQPAAGAHTYDLYLNAISDTTGAIVTNCQLVAIELR